MIFPLDHLYRFAQAAQAKLMQGGRDFIVNSMLDAAQSTVRDNTGEMGFALNSLSKWIDTNEGWMKKSGMFSQDQMDVVKAIRDAPKTVTGKALAAQYDLSQTTVSNIRRWRSHKAVA
mgnify:CR=1 FL=1